MTEQVYVSNLDLSEIRLEFQKLNRILAKIAEELANIVANMEYLKYLYHAVSGEPLVIDDPYGPG